MRRSFFAMLLLLFVAGRSIACSPEDPKYSADTIERVEKSLKESASVVIATLTEVKKVTTKDKDSKVEYPVEQARFHVDKVFKGKNKIGDTFVIISGISSCARSVIGGSPPYLENAGMNMNLVGYQWLIYQDKNPVLPLEITNSVSTRPVFMATFDVVTLDSLTNSK